MALITKDKVLLAFVGVIVVAHSIDALRVVIRETNKRRQIRELREEFKAKFNAAETFKEIQDVSSEFNFRMSKI